MTGNQGQEPMSPARRGVQCTATRWATNHNWCRRGDNTKYKEKK